MLSKLLRFFFLIVKFETQFVLTVNAVEITACYGKQI